MGVAGDRSATEGGLDTRILCLAVPGSGGNMCAASSYLPPPVSFGLLPGPDASGLGIFRLSCLKQ